MEDKSYPNKVRSFLSSNGWVKYTSFGKPIWCKRFDTPTRCKCNDDKSGVQIVIKEHEFDGWLSCSIDLTAKKQDDEWVEISIYGISDGLIEMLDRQCHQLLAAWEAMNK